MVPVIHSPGNGASQAIELSWRSRSLGNKWEVISIGSGYDAEWTISCARDTFAARARCRSTVALVRLLTVCFFLWSDGPHADKRRGGTPCGPPPSCWHSHVHEIRIYTEPTQLASSHSPKTGFQTTVSRLISARETDKLAEEGSVVPTSSRRTAWTPSKSTMP